jgi:hypothetical protein
VAVIGETRGDGGADVAAADDGDMHCRAIATPVYQDWGPRRTNTFVARRRLELQRCKLSFSRPVRALGCAR